MQAGDSSGMAGQGKARLGHQKTFVVWRGVAIRGVVRPGHAGFGLVRHARARRGEPRLGLSGQCSVRQGEPGRLCEAGRNPSDQFPRLALDTFLDGNDCGVLCRLRVAWKSRGPIPLKFWRGPVRRGCAREGRVWRGSARLRGAWPWRARPGSVMSGKATRGRVRFAR